MKSLPRKKPSPGDLIVVNKTPPNGCSTKYIITDVSSKDYSFEKVLCDYNFTGISYILIYQGIFQYFENQNLLLCTDLIDIFTRDRENILYKG